MPDAPLDKRNPAPGFVRNPDHEVRYTPANVHVVGTVNGKTVVDSRNAILVEETNHGPVHYIPMTDCDLTVFTPTAKKTYCPYKSQASYWTITVGDTVLKDIAWSYDTPYDEAAGLKGHFGFYSDRFDRFEIR